MKRILFFSSLVWFASIMRGESIKLANGEWLPFLSEKLPQNGYASDIVTQAFKEAGIDVTYQFYPWGRAEQMVEKGEIAGSVVWSKSEKREKFALFSDTVIIQENVLFYPKSHPIRWEKFEDLYGITIAVPVGSKLGIFEEAIKAGKIKNVFAPNVQSCMEMAALHRVDAFPLAKEVGYQTIRNSSPAVRDSVTHHPKALSTIEYRLMLSKAAPNSMDILQRFNKGLQILKDNGKFAKLEQAFQEGKYD